MSVAKSIKPHISFLLARPSVMKNLSKTHVQKYSSRFNSGSEGETVFSLLWKLAQIDTGYMLSVGVVVVVLVVVARMVERMLASVVSVEELVLSA